LNRDHIGYAGGINLYSYVGSSPINGSDALGFSGSNGLLNFLAGLGDGMSFGATKHIRDFAFDLCGFKPNVDTGSGADFGGNLVGNAVTTVATAGAGAPAGALRGTGAFLEGVEGGTGLGILEGKAVQVSEKGLGLVEEHLARFGSYPENAAMIERLQQALSVGEKVTGADASFYVHEAYEATLMNRGIAYEAAHAAALERYGVSQFSVYAKEVVEALPSHFPNGFREFWGIIR
jgi:hypothetical protein